MEDKERIIFMRELTKDHTSYCDCLNCKQAKWHLALTELEPHPTLTCDLKDGEFKNGRRG